MSKPQRRHKRKPALVSPLPLIPKPFTNPLPYLSLVHFWLPVLSFQPSNREDQVASRRTAFGALYLQLFSCDPSLLIPPTRKPKAKIGVPLVQSTAVRSPPPRPLFPQPIPAHPAPGERLAPGVQLLHPAFPPGLSLQPYRSYSWLLAVLTLHWMISWDLCLAQRLWRHKEASSLDRATSPLLSLR